MARNFSRLAATLGIVPTVVPRPMSQAAATLTDLAAGAYAGAAVLLAQQ
jgi:hypothetical protein